MAVLLGAALAIALVLPSTAPASTCSDYDTQAEAQRAADTVDADGDGIYCESLPCPCLKPGGGGGGGGDPTPTPTATPKPPKRSQTIKARITRVVDGDTIKVRASGAKRDFYTVRLLGIDTPETKRPGVAIECGGKRASGNMLKLAFTAPEDTDGDGILDTEGGEGRSVTMRTDPTQDTFDRYDRLLAYVTTVAGVNLGSRQIGDGWAKVLVFDKPFQKVARFRQAESKAKKAGRGAWKLCGGNFHKPA
jgi:micrococcal nuclease